MLERRFLLQFSIVAFAVKAVKFHCVQYLIICKSPWHSNVKQGCHLAFFTAKFHKSPFWEMKSTNHCILPYKIHIRRFTQICSYENEGKTGSNLAGIGIFWSNLAPKTCWKIWPHLAVNRKIFGLRPFQQSGNPALMFVLLWNSVNVTLTIRECYFYLCHSKFFFSLIIEDEKSITYLLQFVCFYYCINFFSDFT